VVVEELVDEAVVRADPNRTIIPGIVVDAVVVEPWGAHPSYVQGHYDRDNRFYRDWDPSAATRPRPRPGCASGSTTSTAGLPTRRSWARRGWRRCGRPARPRPGRRLRRVPLMSERQVNAPGAPTPGEVPAFSKSEMMIVAAARELAGQRVCFVGVGLPNIAVNLAKRTVARTWSWSTRPASSALVRPASRSRSATRRSSPGDRGRQHVGTLRLLPPGRPRGRGVLGAAQIDRFGNINTTVIGEYAAPKTRLPGSGGACEIAINARQIFVIMRQSARSFVDRIDFRTSPGNLGGAEKAERIRREQGWLAAARRSS